MHRWLVVMVIVVLTGCWTGPVAPQAPRPTLDPGPPPPAQREVTAVPLSDARADRPDTPPLDGGRLLGEIFLGYAVGGLGAFAGAGLGSALCGRQEACLFAILAGIGIGGTVGMTAGVYTIGVAGPQAGSFGSTLLGTMIGAGIGAAGVAAAGGAGLVALVVAPMAGALIGFNASRKWQSGEPPVGSIVRLDRGRVSLGVPLVIHHESRGTSTTLVPLLSGSF